MRLQINIGHRLCPCWALYTHTVHCTAASLDFATSSISRRSMLTANANLKRSSHSKQPAWIFVIYMPTGSPKLKRLPAFTEQELHAFEHALPSGGTTSSTHYPKDALSWVETHFNDGLLACMRLRGLGGPGMATMLFPEMPALALFGSIKRKWVLRAAKTLADISGFPVIIQPRSDDPTLQWNRPPGSHEGSDVEAERDRGGEFEAGGMVPPTTDEDHIDQFAGWMSPVHRSDIRLHLCTAGNAGNITHDVTIAAETQFKVQDMFLDKHRNGFPPRPQIVSRTHLKATSGDLQVLPSRSHSNVGFVSREQWISGKKWFNCGFDRDLVRAKPRRSRFATIIPCLSPCFPLRLPRPPVEYRDNPDPQKWVASYSEGSRLLRPHPSEFASWDIAYDARVKDTRHPMEVVFSMGLKVPEEVDPRSAAPTIAFLCRNQSVLWVPNDQLKSKGFGIIVVTSSWIPNCQSRSPIISVQDDTIDLRYHPPPQPTGSHTLRSNVPKIGMKLRNSLLNRWHSKFDLSYIGGNLDSIDSLGWVPEQRSWARPIYPAFKLDKDSMS
ncbi:hypothetical protein C8R47DRAFT_1167840 [Mycena vitilis]|nr:hypothetical protein C8R47DRAFT_1167840 [Mycena vitilis]